MAEPLVEIQNLTVKYRGRKDPALREVNLTLRQGETVLLLGTSGCGKAHWPLPSTG